MNKKLIVIIIAIILLVVGAITYLALTQNTNTSNEQTSLTVAQDEIDVSGALPPQGSPDEIVPVASQPVVATRNGAYIDYSSTVIASTAGTKILFFHAPWCSQCRQAEQSIKADGIATGTTIIKVDYDTNQVLRQKHGVTIQTTFVKVDDAGNKIASFVAFDEPTIASVERALLQ